MIKTRSQIAKETRIANLKSKNDAGAEDLQKKLKLRSDKEKYENMNMKNMNMKNIERARKERRKNKCEKVENGRRNKKTERNNK